MGLYYFIETEFIFLSEQRAIAIQCNLGMIISLALYYSSFV